MARNGSGIYNPPTNSWSPAVNGVSATAVDWNAILNDLGSALTQSVSADGQTPITGSLNMGGNRLTNLAAGIATGQSLRFEQLFDQGVEQDVASASTTDIGVVNSNFIRITGTTSITSFGTNYRGPRFVRFGGVLTLTHNATTLILPTSANITTAAGDRAIITPIGNPSSGWQVLAYQRADGGILGGVVSIANGGTGASTAVGARASLEATRGIQPVSASVGSNALTLTLNPTTLDFRSTTLGSGAVNTRSVNSAINLTISSGSTLGTINGVASRIAILAIDNAGTVELAAVNMAGGANLDETTLISTTAEGGAGAADSATVIYSTTARTSVPFRVVGYVESTQATAGTWATAPSLVQGYGGQAMAAMQSFGIGQVWTTLTGSRVSGTTYYNTTAKPIMVMVTPSTGASPTTIVVTGTTLVNAINTAIPIPFVVPVGGSYAVTPGGGVAAWFELR